MPIQLPYDERPVRVIQGDCVEVLPRIESGVVDAVICDPPYPEIDRPYGRMTEAEWHKMMDVVVPECRRVLKPSGSAVFILQANSERVGRMRPWLWEFMAKWTREWGMVQDVYWWNNTAMPTRHATRDNGLCRPSVKPCVWLGPENCWRDQDNILWQESKTNAATNLNDRALNYFPSGFSTRRGRQAQAAKDRGGTTPFNLLPIANSVSNGDSAGVHGHGAGTPLSLSLPLVVKIHLPRWWVDLGPIRGFRNDGGGGDQGSRPMSADRTGRRIR